MWYSGHHQHQFAFTVGLCPPCSNTATPPATKCILLIERSDLVLERETRQSTNTNTRVASHMQSSLSIMETILGIYLILSKIRPNCVVSSMILLVFTVYVYPGIVIGIHYTVYSYTALALSVGGAVTRADGGGGPDTPDTI